MAARCPANPTIDCDVSALAPDVVTIDVLAGLQLAARRLGLQLRLHGASAELQDLVAFFGLRDALSVEVERQAEEGEQGLGVEEERELDDPAG
jgi:ABC-type transporter Mla MlaB component